MWMFKVKIYKLYKFIAQKKLESFKTVVADISKSETLNGTEGLYSEIHSELVSLLQELETLRSPDVSFEIHNEQHKT